jgi:hypothetical protein
MQAKPDRADAAAVSSDSKADSERVWRDVIMHRS